MTVSAALPLNVANAYGIAPRPPVAVAPIAPPQASRAIDLVAGQVSGPGGLGSLLDATLSPPASAMLQLYTRAADKVEAATSVNVGRLVDLEG